MIKVFINNSLSSFDLHLYNHAIDLSASIDDDFLVLNDTPRTIVRKKPTHQMLPFHRSFLQISTISGQLISRSANLKTSTLPFDLNAIKKLNSSNAVYETISSNKLPIENNLELEEFRLISTLIIRPPLQNLVLQVAAPLTVIEQSTSELRKFLLIMIPITMLVAIFFGVVISSQALNPMSKMIYQAKRIESGELKERIPVPSNDPELSDLATTLNRLLDRLINMISTQQRFIADASHQLKTPLAIMKIQVEKKETAEQLNQLIKLTENLLTLAQVDADRDTGSFHEFRFDEMIIEIISTLEKIAQSKSIRINTNFFTNDDMESPFSFKGDPELLKQLCVNIIENAIKYSNENSIISVDLKDSQNEIELLVRDTGVGISNEEKVRVFDRFFRGKNTSLKSKGSGLGLAIAQSIAELHHGKITINDNSPRGSVFRVSLPKHFV